MKTTLPSIKLLMLPKDTNSLGSIFGGVILSNIDLAAAVHAKSVAPLRYVTKVMHEVEFIAPVKVGDAVSFYAETVKIGNTSVTIKVLVQVERGIGKTEKIKVTEAKVVMVAVDKEGNPMKIDNSLAV